MGPVIKREDLQKVVDQVNGRFDFFTRKVEELENRIKVLEGEKAPAKRESK